MLNFATLLIWTLDIGKFLKGLIMSASLSWHNILKQTAFVMVLLVKQSNLLKEKWFLITEVSTSAFNWSKWVLIHHRTMGLVATKMVGTCCWNEAGTLEQPVGRWRWLRALHKCGSRENPPKLSDTDAVISKAADYKLWQIHKHVKRKSQIVFSILTCQT